MLKKIVNLILKYYLYSFLFLAILLMVQFFFKPSNSKENKNTNFTEIQDSILIDERDGQTYRIRKFDSNWWMIDNLNFDMGDNLYYEDSYVGLGSYYYDNNPEINKKFGRLYDLSAAVNSCPKGWRLPKEKEWKELNDKYSNCTWDRNSPTANKRVSPPYFEPVGGGIGHRNRQQHYTTEKKKKGLGRCRGLDEEGNYWCNVKNSNKPRFFSIDIAKCEARVTHYQGESTRKRLAQGIFLSCRCVKETSE